MYVSVLRQIVQRDMASKAPSTTRTVPSPSWKSPTFIQCGKGASLFHVFPGGGGFSSLVPFLVFFSMKKLRNLCASSSCDNLRWLGSIEDTKWLVYIRQLLKAALHVASLLRSGESVLLHCSHGWDRTSQIASLAQIFVDPYFRTWKGFQGKPMVLV
jgi:hypothetical protein